MTCIFKKKKTESITRFSMLTPNNISNEENTCMHVSNEISVIRLWNTVKVLIEMDKNQL